MTKETLEEAAMIELDKILKEDNKHHGLENICIRFMKAGATWQINQEERKYTEEDIIVFSNWMREEDKNHTTKELFNAWFNNNK